MALLKHMDVQKRKQVSMNSFVAFTAVGIFMKHKTLVECDKRRKDEAAVAIVKHLLKVRK